MKTESFEVDASPADEEYRNNVRFAKLYKQTVNHFYIDSDKFDFGFLIERKVSFLT